MALTAPRPVDVVETPLGERTVWRWACDQHGELERRGLTDRPPTPSCPTCDRERRQTAQERRSAVRRPPALPHLNEPGCSVCGAHPLPPRRRSYCSQVCADFAWMLQRPEVITYQLVTLHGYRCWTCGTDTYALDLDHVRPLWSLTDEERLDLRWWLPFNLQLLCTACHKAKTRSEAAQRALARRAALPARPPTEVHQQALPL